ncbi:Cold-shock DEAD box protein A [Candidatus Portiera aleyrodidarum]|uniref:DEAD/DEAH box helicase n=1 Tax=Candidatus Portiera aleyrodidarum TaxID=91844 RepID=UPI0005D9408A|nr:DEAD/DEAH box helicase [Candidatus Portiera aleyrodidarum]CEL12341.1 Cold-shock DEAD box protein A [Candidatus Portiera aleyrodidarum]
MNSSYYYKIKFKKFALLPAVLKSIKYENPFTVQIKTIPWLLEGRDLLGKAQTGTGKTAAFALPLLTRIDVTIKHTQVLVLAPTREIAQQVSGNFLIYGKYVKNISVITICGGQEYREQLRGLNKAAHIVVGTPGRVIDHLIRGSMNLKHLNALVLDEADEMLRMGFIEDIEIILKKMPVTTQKVFFSATLPFEIEPIVNRYLVNPIKIQIEYKTVKNTIIQKLCKIENNAKIEALARIIEIYKINAAIVFVRTRASCSQLVEKLTSRSISAAALSGDLNQKLRDRTVYRLKLGKVNILVATDIAARGLDFPSITHVINYDIPNDKEAYIHRIGRTGRAGRVGTAITFVNRTELRKRKWLEKALGQKMEIMEIPDVKALRDHRDRVFKNRVTTILASRNYNQRYLDQRYLVQELVDKGLNPIELAAVFAHLAREKEAKIHEMPKKGVGGGLRKSRLGRRKGDRKKTSKFITVR